MIIKPLHLINTTALLQQRYVLPVALLFYLYNDLTVANFILFQSIYYIISLIAEIPAGYIADIFSRKRILLFSYLLYIGRLIMWLFFRGYWAILLGEIFFGLSKSFSRGVSDSYIYDYLKSQNKSQKMLKCFGRYNFYFSIASAISGFLGAYLYKNFDSFTILLMIELFLNISSMILIGLLPNITHKQLNKKSFLSHFKTLVITFKKTLSNQNINLFICYSAILTSVTNILAWSFQPSMKSAHVPVIVFGFIYFINHMMRGGFSFYSKEIIQKISYQKLGVLVGITHTFSLVLLYLNQTILNPVFCILSLIFICTSIGFQMMYYCATTSRVHDFIPSSTRATASSVLTMLAAFFSGGFLYLFKRTTDGIGTSFSYVIFGFLFVILAFFFCLKAKKSLNWRKLYGE